MPSGVMQGIFGRRTSHLRQVVYVFCVLVAPAIAGAAESPATPAARAKLIENKVIGERAQHNGFTDLIRFKDNWYCIFREAQTHGSFDGKLRILASADGDEWKSVAMFSYKTGDMREARFSITPDGRLMALGAVRFPKPSGEPSLQSLVWFSMDGTNWSEASPVGEDDRWLWRATWHGGTAYCGGYRADREGVSLCESSDGRQWKTLVEDWFPEKRFPNEGSLVFAPDDTAYCLLRCGENDGHAHIGTAKPPYDKWQWRNLHACIGGPNMIQLPDGRLLAGIRYNPVRESRQGSMSLCWVDPVTGTLSECLQLAPAGGDTGYPGMVFHDGLLWMSYYAGRNHSFTKVYLAKVKLP